MEGDLEIKQTIVETRRQRMMIIIGRNDRVGFSFDVFLSVALHGLALAGFFDSKPIL
jgi:hypothetical protein